MKRLRLLRCDLEETKVKRKTCERAALVSTVSDFVLGQLQEEEGKIRTPTWDPESTETVVVEEGVIAILWNLAGIEETS